MLFGRRRMICVFLLFLALELQTKCRRLYRFTISSYHPLFIVWDSTGRKAFDYWRSFPNIKAWPSAKKNNPGDDF
jgi:hypothetical protein